MSEDLWVEGQSDGLGELAPKRRPHVQHVASGGGRHIGCPLWWFTLVFPVVRGKNELAVALYLYRLRSIRRSRTVAVSNERLLNEMGINRYSKYRALRRLADAGIIQVERHNRRALVVSFCEKRGRALGAKN